MSRIHILGASGSGTTTLGAALAGRLALPRFDTDDFFWQRTDPPYQHARGREERQRLLGEALVEHPGWVLSGSLCGWGDFLIPQMDLVVFLWIPADIRMQRLREREYARYGKEIDDPAHPSYQTHVAFLDWAAQYDTGGPDMRSLAMHREWLRKLPGQVVQIEEAVSVAESVSWVLAALGEQHG